MRYSEIINETPLDFVPPSMVSKAWKLSKKLFHGSKSTEHLLKAYRIYRDKGYGPDAAVSRIAQITDEPARALRDALIDANAYI